MSDDPERAGDAGPNISKLGLNSTEFCAKLLEVEKVEVKDLKSGGTWDRYLGSKFVSRGARIIGEPAPLPVVSKPRVPVCVLTPDASCSTFELRHDAGVRPIRRLQTRVAKEVRSGSSGESRRLEALYSSCLASERKFELKYGDVSVAIENVGFPVTIDLAGAQEVGREGMVDSGRIDVPFAPLSLRGRPDDPGPMLWGAGLLTLVGASIAAFWSWRERQRLQDGVEQLIGAFERLGRGEFSQASVGGLAGHLGRPTWTSPTIRRRRKGNCAA